MEHQDCLICKKNKATKTNSHLIPSFIVSKVCSYDGSGKRGKEVMFTLKSYENKVYLGAVPDTKIEELFDLDKLTDERIDEELKDNTVSKDYIFCPCCENKLSKYLESPYAEYLNSGKAINADISYFFWLSIVWRISISKLFQFALPSSTEQHLSDCLNEYLDAIAKGQDVTEIMKKCNFSYRLLRCPSYPSNKPAYLDGKYCEAKGILILTLGDSIICVKLDNGPFPNDFSHVGLEGEIKSAVLNNGTSEEKCTLIESKAFEEAIKKIAEEEALKRLKNEKELADFIWKEVGLSGSMPDEIFKVFMGKLYSENLKFGDVKTSERYVELFNEALESSGCKSI